MAIKLRARIVGTKELQRRLKQLNPQENTRVLRDSLSEAAGRVQADVALNQIVHGRTKAPPLPDRLTNRHGGRGLVGSIRGDRGVDRSPLPWAIEIGTNLVYGAVHEEGRGRFPRRPFLAPGLEKIKPKLAAIFVKHWRKLARL